MIAMKGAEVSAKIKEEIDKKLKQLEGYIPVLAIVRVGENPDDISYEKGAVKRMEKLGMKTKVFTYPADISSQEFKSRFAEINQDAEVDGILLLRPLPKHICEKDIEKIISPDKDLDGISPENIAKVFAGDESGFAPLHRRGSNPRFKSQSYRFDRKENDYRRPQHGSGKAAGDAGFKRKCHCYRLPYKDKRFKRDLPKRRHSGGCRRKS